MFMLTQTSPNESKVRRVTVRNLQKSFARALLHQALRVPHLVLVRNNAKDCRNFSIAVTSGNEFPTEKKLAAFQQQLGTHNAW